MNIFIWTLLNFIGIIIEDIGISIGKSKQYYKMQKTYLSSKNTKRLHCILASPLLAMSAISNFYFLGGQEIGNVFIQNILHGKFIIYFSTNEARLTTLRLTTSYSQCLPKGKPLGIGHCGQSQCGQTERSFLLSICCILFSIDIYLLL